MPFNRKNIRLAPQNYLGYGTYFVTICSHNRNPHFADISFGHVALGHLISLSARHSFLLHAFCLMPDHLHFLSEGNSPQSNLLRFVTAFKQRTALAHKNRTAGPLWQTKFYDHILRAPDQLESVACYIWTNPIRKGLCEEATLYPLSGSHISLAGGRHAIRQNGFGWGCLALAAVSYLFDSGPPPTDLNRPPSGMRPWSYH